MRTENPEFIAERQLIGETADRGRFPVHIRIGKPYPSAEDWRCPVSIDGLWGRLADQVGVDSFQAQVLAFSLVRQLLESFVEKGGLLLWPGEESKPVSLEIAFGKLRI